MTHPSTVTGITTDSISRTRIPQEGPEPTHDSSFSRATKFQQGPDTPRPSSWPVSRIQQGPETPRSFPAAPKFQQGPERHLLFLLLIAASLWFAPPLRALLALPDQYAYLPFIPLIAIVLAALNHHRILSAPRFAPLPALPLMVLSAILANHPTLPLATAALVGFWIAAFLLCYGPTALRAAAFPATFLLLTIPPPAAALDRLALALQAGSADLAYALFQLCGIPVFRQGFDFALPGLTIQIAEQCSGIRSTTALLLTAILAGHIFLRSPWTKLSLIAFAAAAGLLKNALRIVALTTVTAYTPYDLLQSPLHHQYGGIVFSCLALGLIVPFVSLLRKLEANES